MNKLQLLPIKRIKHKGSIDQRFAEFHKNNPHVYQNLLHLAIQVQLAGRKRIGMKSLYERIRWEYVSKTKYEQEDFKLDNNFTSRYARMIVNNVPYLKGMFELRDLRAR